MAGEDLKLTGLKPYVAMQGKGADEYQDETTLLTL
jgi:hypothetical protein